MCEVPARSWRELVAPQRLLIAVVAVAAMVVGALLEPAVGLVVIGVGAVLLFAAVLLPAVTAVELGFPTGVKLFTASHQREVLLQASFGQQRAELELCARLLAGDADAGPRLLEAAWARAAARWRGPMGPELRTYVLCVLVRLVHAHVRWAGAATVNGPLAGLSWEERVVVVLHEFAGLTVNEVSAIVGRPPVTVQSGLDAAEQTLR